MSVRLLNRKEEGKNMKGRALALVLVAFLGASAHADIAIKQNIRFYSEAVACSGTLFLPEGFGAADRAMPAVVLAPEPGKTQASLEPYAKHLAMNGIAAFTFDYRGWGKSGGFLYFGEPVRWDDRLRFTSLTAKMRIRRLRLDPRAQVIDIRNAMTWLQGEKGIDRARVGVWGAGLAGDHAIVTAASDARVKAAVAQRPGLAGKEQVRQAFAPTEEQQAAMVKLARNGAPPASEAAARKMNQEESQLALAEYRPYWYVEQIPQTTAVLFIGPEGDVVNTATAASKLLKGPAQVSVVPSARGEFDDSAAKAASDWFAKHL
jgi:dienelactone hydrolase